MIQLASILDQYHDAFPAQYGSRLLPGHLQAIEAIRCCRTPEAGQLLVQCTHCGYASWRPRSCGHRSCPQCRNHETSLWLDRQQAKLLPVDYFMVTFTLPYELRFPAWDNQSLVYDLLFACLSGTLKDFGLNPKNLGADIGMTAVLHTHNRRLDYHPHIHVVVPGGGVDRAKKQWKRRKPSTSSMNSPRPGCFAPAFSKHGSTPASACPCGFPKMGGPLHLRRQRSLCPEVSVALPLPGCHQ